MWQSGVAASRDREASHVDRSAVPRAGNGEDGRLLGRLTWREPLDIGAAITANTAAGIITAARASPG
jgi:hypothetical protein